jgi:hypothetical protein
MAKGSLNSAIGIGCVAQLDFLGDAIRRIKRLTSAIYIASNALRRCGSLVCLSKSATADFRTNVGFHFCATSFAL